MAINETWKVVGAICGAAAGSALSTAFMGGRILERMKEFGEQMETLKTDVKKMDKRLDIHSERFVKIFTILSGGKINGEAITRPDE